jgi:hypothetical protein
VAQVVECCLASVRSCVQIQVPQKKMGKREVTHNPPTQRCLSIPFWHLSSQSFSRSLNKCNYTFILFGPCTDSA